MINSLVYYVQSGGVIMYILVFLNATGLSLVAFKFIELSKELSAAQRTFKRLLQEALEVSANTACTSQATDPNAALRHREILSARLEAYALQRQWGMNTIKTIASVSPILGLLGTVVGVLDAFEKMANGALGAGAGAFAGGISLALVTTIGGLIVAIPHLVAYNYLSGLLEKLENKLENLAQEAAL